MKYLLILTILICTSATFPALRKQPAPKHIEQYVQRFLKTAQAEAERFNIPVSITLAQGIIESNAGRSQLSRRHNNHFGIKWRGFGKYAVYADDSPKDRFQVYKSAWHSYRAHSKLLAGNRYGHLCKLNRLQYRKWARGLKKCGYATEKRYAEILINVIEKYQLWKFDLPNILKF